MAGGRTIRANVVESLPPGKTEWDSEVRGFGVRRQRRDAFYIVKSATEMAASVSSLSAATGRAIGCPTAPKGSHPH